MTAIAERTAAAPRSGRVRLEAIDPDLARLRPSAAGATVTVIEIPAGREPLPAGAVVGPRGGIVVKGILLGKVEATSCSICELLAPGDILARDDAEAGEMAPATIEWRALERTLVADISSLDSPDPAVELAMIESVNRRLQHQARRSSVERAIASIVRVDVRLLSYLWHLAETFATITPLGVKLDLPLTHALLADLVGARRPTVTTAFGTLADGGYLRREGRSILLFGDGEEALKRLASGAAAPRGTLRDDLTLRPTA